MLRGTVTLFWLLFLADGIFSAADEVISLAIGSSPLSVVRGILAFVVLAMSLLMVLIIGVTPKAPKRFLIPPILFAWWAGPGMAFQLGLWKVPYLPFALALLQVLIALALWHSARGPNGMRWTLPFPVNDSPTFSWRHFLVAAPLTVLVFALFAASCILVGFSAQVESLTGGYVRVRPDGI